MRIKEFAEKLGMKVFTNPSGLEKEVSGIYACDLLSWVMSHAQKEDAWITVHTHLNTIAVAVLTEISCIIVPEDISVEEPTIMKADQEGIVILGSSMSAYEICWRAYECLKDK